MLFIGLSRLNEESKVLEDLVDFGEVEVTEYLLGRGAFLGRRLSG